MRAIVLAAVLSLAGPAWGQEAPAGFTGMLLKKMCSGEAGQWEDGGCLSYVIGFSDGLEFGGMITLASLGQYDNFDSTYERHQAMVKICRPKDSTNEQAKLVVVKFLDDHPERLHEQAKFLVASAFSEAFPCHAQ